MWLALCALFFVAAQISYECAEVARGVTTGFPLWWMPVFSVSLSLVATVTVLWRHRSHLDYSKYRSVLSPLIHIGNAFLAEILGVFTVFATAYTTISLVIVWIYVLGMFGMVNYNEREQHFFLQSSTAYALLRGGGELLVIYAFVSCRLARLLPFAAATVETLAMVCLRSQSYTFGVTGPRFVIYAVLKWSLFLSLPLLEDVLLDKCL